MTDFYTSINRYGNFLLYRGYSEGHRVKKKIKFKPTLYVKGKGNSEYNALDGTNVDPIKFDSMREAKEFIEQYKDVDQFNIYGNNNYIAQYVAQEFPGVIKYDRHKVRVHNIDIEVLSDEGFPEPKDAKHPITAITIHDSITDLYVVFGYGDYDVDIAENKEISIEYRQFNDEKSMLGSFIDYWHDEFTCPDVITGWNIRGFDIPYIVNRTYRLYDEDKVKMLSPWKMVDEKMVTMRKGQVQMYDLVGIAQLDYMDLFMKFGYSFGPQENYRLDNIANVVLGERKLSYEEYSNLSDLYYNNYQKYIDYNIRDVTLVSRMEDKIAMITLCLTMSYKAGVNYSDTFGTVGIWDSFIHKTLYEQKTIVPPNKEKFRADYDGGYVKNPHCGVHDWVCSFDVNSLYPNIIVQWNMSPETLLKGDVEPMVTVDKMLDGFTSEDPTKSMAATGQYFSNKKQGFMPKMIEELYSERKVVKGKMLKSKQELEGCDKSNKQEMYRIERDIAQFENEQMAIKILLNSLYGAMGNKYFRYFAMEIAEGITITGQYIIKWAEKHVNNYLNTILRNDKDYVIAIDTDSVYVGLSDLVKAAYGDRPHTDAEVVDFLDQVCAKIESDVLDTCFEQLKDNCTAYKQRIAMKREGIANRGIWTAKKRYILNIWDNEGVRYAEPKLKMMGIEAIKSSTPAPCRKAFKDLFKILIEGTEEQTQKFIANFKNEFFALPAEDKAFPRGVSSVKGYMDSKTIFKKGTPINSRSAILYNYMLKHCEVEKKYEKIQDGEKIKYIHLNPRNPLRQDVIGFYDILPPEFGLHQYIDNEKQFDKAFLTPAKLILDSIGWRAEETASLDDFFGG